MTPEEIDNLQAGREFDYTEETLTGPQLAEEIDRQLDKRRSSHCRYPIPNAPGFYCSNPAVHFDLNNNGYCQQHKAFSIG